ncbi:sarcosine oxidase subunit delta [Nocardiopsis chromatogenes]|uniref:sarcosine oxidase subunit delta n=1 Tax=Nocardiopsis chromatogenes TaxID=280239 RepID=UPI0003474B41|nr:sarcosine oxidase subunit delta [Nocardiopsis chromatogenes]
MLLIPCPWCGPRDEREFRYGGQAHIAYPADPEALDDGAWADYLFVRDNPAGPYAERWFHASGCRSWCDVERDTVDYTVTGSCPTGAHPAAGPDEGPCVSPYCVRRAVPSTGGTR